MKRKLIVVITATSALTLVLAALTTVFRDVIAYRSNLVDELNTVAEIVGANSTAALLFDDPAAANEVLAALSADTQIVECRLYSPDGRLFARYARKPSPAEVAPWIPIEEGHQFEGGLLRVSRDVRLDGDRIGTLAITADLERLYAQLRQDAATAGLFLLLSVAVAVVISAAAQHFVSEPILELAGLAKKITADKSYSARAVQRTNDEVGLLTRSLNEMLDEIQLRDGALREAHDALGTHVKDLRKLTVAVEQSPASVSITDQFGNLEYVNPRFEELTGYSQAEVLGRTARFMEDGIENATEIQVLRETIMAGRQWRGELRNRRKNGEEFWEQVSVTPLVATDGSISNFLSVTEDITVRKEYENRLLHQATVDPLTGLPNRLLALDRLAQAVEGNSRGDDSVAVMFVDLDSFKMVNDTLGHAVGDDLLRETARKLEDSVRPGDTVARLGGDEFLVVVPKMKDESLAEHLARRIRSLIADPFAVNGREVFVTASIGIAIGPNDGEDADELLRNADAAMYKAKQQGRDSHLFFEPEMNEQVLERLSLESNLRLSLKEGELSVHYQPVVDIEEDRIIGAEALLRWDNPELGSISPEDFIPVAEDTGMIIPIGEWVLRTACRDAKTWHEETGAKLSVAVNVSSRQFRHALFVDSVSRALADSGLPPTCLELEVTESLLMEDSPRTSEALAQIDELGVRLAVDDFGTGFSALSYLKRFPFDILKIDRSFVRDVVTDVEDATLVSAIIAMGQSLHLKVVAEGAETREQLEFLSSEGCRLVQGFYFAKAVPQDEFLLMTADSPRRVGRDYHPKMRLLADSTDLSTA